MSVSLVKDKLWPKRVRTQLTVRRNRARAKWLPGDVTGPVRAEQCCSKRTIKVRASDLTHNGFTTLFDPNLVNTSTLTRRSRKLRRLK